MNTENLKGHQYRVSGMIIEVVTDGGAQDPGNWQVRNVTTGQQLSMDRQTLVRAIKLGKAEVLPGNRANNNGSAN